MLASLSNIGGNTIFYLVRTSEPELESPHQRNATCLFDSSVCLAGPKQAISMVSDLIDTREALGINTPDSDRLLYRRTSTCAVLNLTDLVYNFNVTFAGRTTSDPCLGLDFGNVPQYDGTLFEDYTCWYDKRSRDTKLGYQLAYLQRSRVDLASGTHAHTASGYTLQPETQISQALCNAQKVPLPSGYQNFSLPGVLLVLVIGAAVNLFAYSIDIVVGFVQRKWYNRPYAWLAWKLDTQLQLHRLAQENAGWGVPWTGQLSSAPAAHTGTSLGIYEEATPDVNGIRTAFLRRNSVGSSDRASSLSHKRSY